MKGLPVVRRETLNWTRDEFIQALRAEGIPSAAGVPPENYKEEVFLKIVGYDKQSPGPPGHSSRVNMQNSRWERP